MGDQPLAHWGNATTHNVETVLHTNILSSRYSKGLDSVAEFSELVDEIYSNVTHVEPWMSGNARGPSTAFCCLNRLFELQPTPRQVRQLLQHPDSPYIRAVGLLFLRYVAEPRTLWSWVEEFLQDREEFAPSADERKKVTMGLFVRELLLDQFYFETIFPRIPEGISRTIKDSLARMGCATVALGCGGIGGTRRQGGGAADEGPSRRPPSVKAALSVSLSQRAPHVAGVRETGRGFANVDPSKHGAGGGGDGGGRGGEHVHHNRGAPGRGPPPSAPPPGQPPWEREREHDHRRQEHYRHGRRSRSRSRSRSRERRHRSHSRERHRSHHRSRSRDRDRDRDRDRERDRHYRRSRSRSGERGRRERAERQEEPQQGPDPGRSAHDVFRALPPPLMTTTTALKDKY